MAKKPKKEGRRLETGMLSFARSLQPSEGLFWGTNSRESRPDVPIEVREKGVRGQSSEFKTENPGMSNPQVVEAAAVPAGCDGIRLGFSMWVAPFALGPGACDDPDVAKTYRELVRGYAEKRGFDVLARLYLWNIANARFAWRNRFLTDEMRVTVEFDLRKDGNALVFDPTRLCLAEPASAEQLRAAALTNEPAAVNELIEWIAQGLTSKATFMKVAWHAKMEEGQEVFPSQEYVRGDQDELKRQKRDGKIASRVYAKFPRFSNGRTINQASMHSQKIGAGLRHIDTWHGHADAGAIAVNPYGGVQETGDVLRAETSRGGLDSAPSFYALRDKPEEVFDAINKATSGDEIPGNVHFLVANLVRGGVFGQ